MTHLWRKDLMKNVDLLFTVPAHFGPLGNLYLS